jgi:hypothetical protein
MTLHSAIGILVAVSIPLWLVVEQVLKWRALGRRSSPSLARRDASAPRTAATPDRRPELTSPAMRRKVS